MNTKITGNAGEKKAADYLEEKGYSILEKNWRKKHRSLDPEPPRSKKHPKLGLNSLVSAGGYLLFYDK